MQSGYVGNMKNGAFHFETSEGFQNTERIIDRNYQNKDLTKFAIFLKEKGMKGFKSHPVSVCELP